MRKNQTAAEELLWRLLRNRRLIGFKFRRQHQFGDYIADFYCTDAELVIECDGDVHDPNEEWHHDQERDAYMISQGLTVLRFSNDRILTDTANVIEAIGQALTLSTKVTRDRPVRHDPDDKPGSIRYYRRPNARSKYNSDY